VKNDCVEFQGCKDTGGYGLKRKNGKLYKAHRLEWLERMGEIPEGLFVCHRCDNPSCINIKHLFLGTNSDNMLDMYSKGRGNSVETIAKKLNWGKAKEIRRSEGTHQEIADKFDIDRTMVGKIKLGLCWKEEK